MKGKKKSYKEVYGNEVQDVRDEYGSIVGFVV